MELLSEEGKYHENPEWREKGRLPLRGQALFVGRMHSPLSIHSVLGTDRGVQEGPH